MKPVILIFFLDLGIQGAMSGNDIWGNRCVAPAVCHIPGNNVTNVTAWLPISPPVCEAGMKRPKGEMGPKGEVGPQGEHGQGGLNSDYSSKGENGEGEVGRKAEKGGIGEPGSGDSLVFQNIIKMIISQILCPMMYENKCFFPVIGREVNYADGVAICENLGGHLANIYSQIHMDDFMKYIRGYRMDGSMRQSVRLGMKYDPKADKLTLRDGTDAPAGLKWYPGRPLTVVASYTSVLLFVNSDPSSIYNYLYNSLPSSTFYVLCEIE